jgi:hypothetical protein
MEYNEKKRHLLGEKIHNSFLHPKPIKIGQINLKSEPLTTKLNLDESKKRKINVESDTITKPISNKKHKFHLV